MSVAARAHVFGSQWEENGDVSETKCGTDAFQWKKARPLLKVRAGAVMATMGAGGRGGGAEEAGEIEE